MEILKWRFPTITGGQTQGLTTGDKETFRKFPYISLAREVLQNSIDVGIYDDKPVEVEFKSFKIDTNKIPGINELKVQMLRCINFWKHREDYIEVYRNMLDILDSPNISCLRISDFNTSGLRGINSTSLEGNRFIALTKGTGVSEKGAKTAAGSKGVGKNAVITLSRLGLIFYSTVTDKQEQGSIGVASLISGYPTDYTTDTNTFTQGQGYYSKDDNISPLDELINLDKSYNRQLKTGTDIYIVGYREDSDWEKEVVSSIIDSFLVAVYKEKLKVTVNDICIDLEHLDEIINTSNYIKSKEIKNAAICGYRMLSGKGKVHTFEIETDYGNPELYVMPIERKEEEISTHECAMIRYPYMRIKNYPLNRSYRVAAMCIIGNDKLGELLRDVENPEHTNWYPKILDNPASQKEVKSIIDSIEEQIDKYILEVMQQGDEGSIDPAKAHEFLPIVDKDGSEKQRDQKKSKEVEETHTTAFKSNSTAENKTPVNEEPGSSLVPEIGVVSDETGDDPYPKGENDSKGGDIKPNPNEGKVVEGDGIVLKNVDKSAIKYKFIVIDKKNGKYRIVFTSPINNSNCYISVNMLDDSNNKTRIEIKEMTCDGNKITIQDNKSVGPFSIYTNKKCIIEIQTESIKGLFGSEVKVTCK